MSTYLLLTTLLLSTFAKAQVVSTITVVPVPAPRPPTCPGSDGSSYLGASGSEFIVECDVDHQGGDMGMTWVESLQDCIDACDAEELCVDVSLSGAACYMKSTLGTSIPAKGLSGARLVPATSTSSIPSSTATATPVVCPGSNGTTYITKTYAQYEIICGSESRAGDIGMQYVANFPACIELCSDTEDSAAASFSGSACYLKDGVGEYTEKSIVSGARMGHAASACPTTGNGTYVSTDGEEFVVECDVDHPGGDISSAIMTGYTADEFLGQCIELCADTEGCVAATLSGSGCYLKGSPLASATTASGLKGARLLTLPSSVPTPSSSAASTPTAISPVDVGSFEYLFCSNDSITARVLSAGYLYGTDDNLMTAEKCGEFCEGYNYFGLEYSQECYCGNSLLNNPVETPSACDMACSGNSTQLCGGGNALSLYRTLGFNANATKPTFTQIIPYPTGVFATGTGTVSVAFPTATGSVNMSSTTNGTLGNATGTTSKRMIRRGRELAPVRLELMYEI